MNSKNLFFIAVSISTILLAASAHADSKPREFLACFKRTEHDRMTCQSGCGMILQQCYDEADDALTKDIDTIVAKSRSASCTTLLKKYVDGSSQQTDSLTANADAQPGWLSAELKMKFLQQRSETVRLIDEMCK
jgi:hypothetical protein